MKTFVELMPGKYDGRKSYYGKAVIADGDGVKILYSYNTPVAKINRRGEFIRLWDGYSATTMRHINSFIDLFGISGGGKKWWDALPVGKM